MLSLIQQQTRASGSIFVIPSSSHSPGLHHFGSVAAKSCVTSNVKQNLPIGSRPSPHSVNFSLRIQLPEGLIWETKSWINIPYVLYMQHTHPAAITVCTHAAGHSIVHGKKIKKKKSSQAKTRFWCSDQWCFPCDYSGQTYGSVILILSHSSFEQERQYYSSTLICCFHIQGPCDAADKLSVLCGVHPCQWRLKSLEAVQSPVSPTPLRSFRLEWGCAHRLWD